MEGTTFALDNPSVVLAMPDMEQIPLLWEALEFVKAEQGKGKFPEEEIERNLKALPHALGAISHRLKLRLREEGAWRNLADPRWPSNYSGDDADHLYKSGAYPPTLMVWPPSDDSWSELDKPTRLRLHKEMATWGKTPAGSATLPGADIDHFIETIAKAQESSDAVRRAKLDWDMAVLCDDLAAQDPERWQ